jgi:hypothetical protein
LGNFFSAKQDKNIYLGFNDVNEIKLQEMRQNNNLKSLNESIISQNKD